MPLDLPGWNAEKGVIPYGPRSVDRIVAFHFFEHLSDPRVMLAECQRVLKIGGVLTLVVPHAWGTMAFQDLDHKAFYVLDTWDILFNNKWYDQTYGEVEWTFEVHANFVMGIVERNLALCTQLVKR